MPGALRGLLNVTKSELRAAMKAVLHGIPAEAAAARSRAVAGRLVCTRQWREAGTVLAFISLPRELDTVPLIAAARAAAKTVAVPRIVGDDLVFHLLSPGLDLVSGRDSFRPGSLGLREPAPEWPLFDPSQPPGDGGILVAAPGLAFDSHGNRLGRGKGYYDRYLALLRTVCPRAVTVAAVCFQDQLVENVPVGAHDQPVDAIVTDQEILWTGG
jgi:5-formyltetrahydrofolate cyclo-ligase